MLFNQVSKWVQLELKHFNGLRELIKAHNIELSDGTIWPMPTCLDVSEEQTLDIEKSELNGVRQLVLRDAEHNPLAVMDVGRPRPTPSSTRDGARGQAGGVRGRRPGGGGELL